MRGLVEPASILFALTLIVDKVGSLSLTNLVFKYTPNIDVHIISLSIQNEALLPITTTYNTAFCNTEIQNPETNQKNGSTSVTTRFAGMMAAGRTQFFKSIKNMLKVDSVSETLQIMNVIGSGKQVLQNRVVPSLLVIWPDPIASEEQATSILLSESFQNSSKGFNIASEFLIGFPINSKALAVPPISPGEDELSLFEAFNVNNQLIVKKLDDGVLHFRCRFCKGPAIRRSNFYGLVLNVSGYEDIEMNDDILFGPTATGDLVISSEGFSGKILQILQKSLNFTVKPLKATDWGRYISENNSWVGSVKDVADGVADFGISATIMTPSRGAKISFLPAADENIISAFFRNPDTSSVRDIFARPFHPDLWAAVFSTWVVLAFFMILFSLIRKRYGLQNTGIGNGIVEPDFTRDSFIWALATACQQGWDDHPVAGSLRTIFISGSFTGVVAYAGYSAAIVSTLSLRVDPIQNPEQLLQSSLKIGIREGFISDLLQQNNTKDTITAYQQKLKLTKESERYLNITAAYANLLKNSYAFISTRDSVYDNLKVNAKDTEICVMKELRLLKQAFPVAHFVSKNSPYKEFFRYMYVTIREPGISWKLRGNYTYKRRCLEASGNAGQALGVNDVFTALMVLAAGYVCSLTFAIIEKVLRVGQTFTYMQ